MATAIRCFKNPEFVNLSDSWLLEFYTKFISEFESKLNPLRHAQLAVRVSQCPAVSASNDDAQQFLSKTLANVKDADAQLVLKCELASWKLKKQAASPAEQETLRRESKTLLDESRARIDAVSGLEAAVNTIFYRVSAEYHKKFGTADEFYRNALLFLSNASASDVAVDAQAAIAYDIALAGLLGDHIFNFGELLQHPIMSSLKKATPLHSAVYDLLVAFSTGNIAAYEKLQPQVAAEPSLSPTVLSYKIRLLALMELIFSRPANNRAVSFADITSHCQSIPILSLLYRVVLLWLLVCV